MPVSLRRGRRLLPLFLVAFLAHAEATQYWFVASDTLPLIETSRVMDTGDFAEIFTQPLLYGSDFLTTALFYRPVASLSYAVDYALWGLTPVGYHVTNLVLHAVAVVLVAIAVTDLTDRPAVGSLTALLFALHPVTAEVVPVTARRQDILLTVFALGSVIAFVRWYRGRESFDGTARRWEPRRLLGVALAAYALALGSKETAVVVPALLAVWVLLRADIDRPRRAFRTLVGTVGPFAAVTVGYLALRIAVLGGFGGYSVASDGSTFPAVAGSVLFVVKYVLWLTYPYNYIEEAATLSVGSLSLVLVPVVILLGGVGFSRLRRRGYFRRRRFRRLRLLSPLGTIAGFAAIPLVLTGATWLESLVSTDASGVLVSYLLGMLFVGSCIGAIVTATLAQDSPLDGARRRQLVFFGCWVTLPLCIAAVSGFVMSKPLTFGFGIRNAYFGVIPTMAILSLLLVPTLRRVRTNARAMLSGEGGFDRSAVVHSDTVRAAGIVLLVVPLLLTSPLIHSSSGWHASGELNEKSLHGLNAALEETPDERFVVIADFPHEFDERQRPYPHAHSVTPLRPYSVEAWLELHGRSNDVQVRLIRKRTVTDVPDDISFRTDNRGGWTAVWTRMTGNFTVTGQSGE